MDCNISIWRSKISKDFFMSDGVFKKITVQNMPFFTTVNHIIPNKIQEVGKKPTNKMRGAHTMFLFMCFSEYLSVHFYQIYQKSRGMQNRKKY